MVRKIESYEVMIKRLEEITQTMDRSELPLDEAIKKYEEGIKLCNKLYKMLNEAEGKIKIVTESGEDDFIKENENEDQ